MAHKGKTVASSSNVDPNVGPLELFSVSAFMHGKWIRATTFNNSSLFFAETCKTIGWNNALEKHNGWYHEPCAIFWHSVSMVNGTLVGEYEGNTIVVSQDLLA